MIQLPGNGLCFEEEKITKKIEYVFIYCESSRNKVIYTTELILQTASMK